MLIQILEAVGKVLGIIQTVQGIVSQIKTLLGQPAQEPTLTDVAGLVAANHSLLTDSGFGLAEISSAVSALTTLVAHDYAALVTQIGNPQQQGSPVTLPTLPPAGWAPSFSSDLLTTIVGTNYGHTENVAGCLVQILQIMGALSQGVWTFSESPWFVVESDGFGNTLSDLIASQPQPLLSHVLPTDTVLSWLTREWPALTWSVGASGQVQATDNATFAPSLWLCIFTDATLQLAARGAVNPTASGLPPEPPVWPGISNVTLGTSLALADGLLVPGPLDGVIVDITAVPYPISFYPFGPIKSFVKVGGIVFVDDNNQGEFAQALALDSGVICPKTMVRADHARLRLQSGTIGTVTPWTRN